MHHHQRSLLKCVCMWGSGAPSGNAECGGRPCLPSKSMHPVCLPCHGRVQSCPLHLSCLASPASGGSVSRGHFGEDPSSERPFLISHRDVLPLPLLHRSLRRWLPPLHMVHPLERCPWLSPGPPPSLKEVVPDGVPHRRWFKLPFPSSGYLREGLQVIGYLGPCTWFEILDPSQGC